MHHLKVKLFKNKAHLLEAFHRRVVIDHIVQQGSLMYDVSCARDNPNKEEQKVGKKFPAFSGKFG